MRSLLCALSALAPAGCASGHAIAPPEAPGNTETQAASALRCEVVLIEDAVQGSVAALIPSQSLIVRYRLGAEEQHDVQSPSATAVDDRRHPGPTSRAILALLASDPEGAPTGGTGAEQVTENLAMEWVLPREKDEPVQLLVRDMRNDRPLALLDVVPVGARDSRVCVVGQGGS
jgi:hypothetical protein